MKNENLEGININDLIRLRTNTKVKDVPQIDGPSHDERINNLGVKNEEDKTNNRKYVLRILLFLIVVQTLFVNWCIYKMVSGITFISDTAFKYYITGVFVNLIVMFKGIVTYLYSDKRSSLLDIIYNKIK